jgi:hypothetical protein
VVSGIEVAVGFLIAWFARKAGRAGRKLDGMADEAIDAGLDKLGNLVTHKLGDDTALRQLEAEVVAGEVATRTETRVRLALEEAAEQDATFGADLDAAVAGLQPTIGVAVAGDVRADRGSVDTVTGGQVIFNNPQGPTRE